MPITVTPSPAKLTWSNFAVVGSLPDVEDAHIDVQFSIPNRPGRKVEGNYMLAESFSIGVSPVAKFKKGAQQTAALLAHEQGHYDIGIAVAWALARDLETLAASTVADLGKQLAATFDLHRLTRMAVVQRQYDLDTNHSLNASQQATWATAIATALGARAATLRTYPL